MTLLSVRGRPPPLSFALSLLFEGEGHRELVVQETWEGDTSSCATSGSYFLKLVKIFPPESESGSLVSVTLSGRRREISHCDRRDLLLRCSKL